MTVTSSDREKRIFSDKKAVIYVGAPIFNDAFSKQDVEVVFVRWRPPRENSVEINNLLRKFLKE